QTLVDFDVDARDEEGCNGVDFGDIQVVCFRAADTSLESLNDLLVAFQGEDQRDVDGNSIRQGFGDGAERAIGSWNLNHDVVAVDAVPQFACLRNGCFAIVGNTRIHFDGNAAVFAAGLLVDFLKDIARVAHVIDSQGVDSFVSLGAFCLELCNVVVIGIALSHGGSKNCGVGGHTHNRLGLQ